MQHATWNMEHGTRSIEINGGRRLEQALALCIQETSEGEAQQGCWIQDVAIAFQFPNIPGVDSSSILGWADLAAQVNPSPCEDRCFPKFPGRA